MCVTAQNAQCKRWREDQMNLDEAIQAAERLLPGTPAPDDQSDPRWKAIIAVGEHIETSPEPIWVFTARWGSHQSDDVRGAVSTCLLEHLLEHHFDLIFPRVEDLAMRNPLFADTFTSCFSFGQAKLNSDKIDQLAEACRKKHANHNLHRTR